MDFGNSKHLEAFIREAEKAIAAANERRSQLSPSSEDAMDEYADLWDDINQYKTAIKIAQLAIKVCSDDDPEPAPVETPEPRKFLVDDRVCVKPGHHFEGMGGVVTHVYMFGTRYFVALDDLDHEVNLNLECLEPEPAD